MPINTNQSGWTYPTATPVKNYETNLDILLIKKYY